MSHSHSFASRNIKVALFAVLALAFPTIAQLAAVERVSGYLQLEAGRVDLKSCVAFTDRNGLGIRITAFKFSQQDLQAYAKTGFARDMAEMEVDERHPVPAGFERHPGIHISLKFDEGIVYEPAAVTDHDVGLAGSGEAGDSWTGLMSRHYELSIVSLSRDSVAGTLRNSAETSSDFAVDFQCQIVLP